MLPLLVLVASASATVACSGYDAPPKAGEGPIVQVAVARAEMTDVAEVFEAGGSVRARTSATLVSRVMSPVVTIHAQPGARVRSGQVLVTLDSRELEARRSQARAALSGAPPAAPPPPSAPHAGAPVQALATPTERRIADLRGRNSATAQELDDATAALDGAKARLQSAEARIAEAASGFEAAQAALDAVTTAASYARITSPFDGLVTEKLIDVGNMAAPGTPLVTVEDVRSFRLEVQVDESRAAWVAPGQAVPVLLDRPSGAAADQPVHGQVSEVARALDAGRHTFTVKIDLPADESVRSGMFGRARFSGPARRALTVPGASLVRRGQITAVFVVEADNRAVLRLVNTAPAVDERVEILAGLAEGDRVVVDPPLGLVDGARVSVGSTAVSDGRSAWLLARAGEAR